jgi:hypothetical protein
MRTPTFGSTLDLLRRTISPSKSTLATAVPPA